MKNKKYQQNGHIGFLVILFIFVFGILLMLGSQPVKAQAIYYLGEIENYTDTYTYSGGAYYPSSILSMYAENEVVGIVVHYGDLPVGGINAEIALVQDGVFMPYAHRVVGYYFGFYGNFDCYGNGEVGNYVQETICPILAPGARNNGSWVEAISMPGGQSYYASTACKLQDENDPYDYIDCDVNTDFQFIYYGVPPSQQIGYYLGNPVGLGCLVIGSLKENKCEGVIYTLDLLVGHIYIYGPDPGCCNSKISSDWGANPKITKEYTSLHSNFLMTDCFVAMGSHQNNVVENICDELWPYPLLLQNIYSMTNVEELAAGNNGGIAGFCHLEIDYTEWIDCPFQATIWPIYYGVQPTPTITPTMGIPPIATIVPCGYEIWDPNLVWDINDNWNWWMPPIGAQDVQVKFSDDAVLVFASETFEYLPDIWYSIDEPTGIFSCFAQAGVCDAAEYQYIPSYCGVDLDLPSIDGDSGFEWGIIDTKCLINITYPAFDLSGFTISTFIEGFGITVPDWGWTAGTWVVCVAEYAITKAEIGTIDFVPSIGILLSGLILMVLGYFVRR